MWSPIRDIDKTPVWRRNPEDIIKDMEKFVEQGLSAVISADEMEILLDYIKVR